MNKPIEWHVGDFAYECEDLHEPCPIHRPEVQTAFGTLRVVRRDGAFQWLLQCPTCAEWADIDEDQFNGRVSVWHDACGYHETHDFNGAMP